MEVKDPPSISHVLQINEDYLSFVRTPHLTTREDTFQFFQKLAELAVEYVQAFEQYCNKTKPTKQQHYEIVVHLTKLCSTCELLNSKYFNQSVAVNEELIMELGHCICKCLTTILESFNDVIDVPIESNIGVFLNLMNIALEKISQIDITKGSALACANLEESHTIIKEILCFSMAIGQVAFGEDPKIITAGCRIVLNTLENIKTEIQQEKPNRPMCNLLVDNCSNALCALEAQVNVAVLRLCLHVFSNYKQPLDDLINKSWCDTQLTDFDLHMDRMFQIAAFSLSSSAVGKGVAAIRAVIETLEFVESELVPLILANSERLSTEGETLSGLLRKFWCENVRTLQKNIHTIIEPSAYCKLIHEELQLKTEALWHNISGATIIQTDLVNPFITYTKELLRMSETCFAFYKQHQQDTIRKNMCIVNCVVKELKSCKDSLEKMKKQVDVHKSNQSLFKRSQILLKAIKQLWISMTEQEPDFDDSEQSVYENSITIDNVEITHIINKSRHLVKARTMHSSIYAFTPTNTGTNLSKYHRKPVYNKNNDEECSVVGDLLLKHLHKVVT